MKKFIVKILLFAVLLGVCDFATGAIFKLYDYTKSGETHKLHALMTREAPDLVVFGSSRASHHYDPKLLADALGVEVYNAGFDGKGTSVSYGILTGLAQRKFPKFILCEISPAFDLDEASPLRGIDGFYPYVGIPGISDYIVDFDNNEQWKLHSNAYRLNSAVLKVVPSIFLNSDDDMLGFLPLYEKLNVDKIINMPKGATRKLQVHPIREKYLRRLVEKALDNDCELVFAVSPMYGGGDMDYFEDEINILREYNVRVLNHLNDSSFINNKDYFADRTHMNVDGAREYTKLIISELKAHF